MMNNNTLFNVSSVGLTRIPWTINVDGFFKQNVERQMLSKGEMSQDSVDRVFIDAARILQHCPNPIDERQNASTGIVIGKVQSGKTSSFISVLSLAFDNAYNVAIVLGGNTLDLLKQNATRIKEAFNVEAEKLTVLKTNDNKELIDPQRIREFIENGRKVIIVGLKRYNHINQIGGIFENDFLSNQPVLIVDDEGDQATLNTKAYLDSMSSTYESVLSLKSKIRRHCFLSVTATPQANILIEAFDKLSPDFGELVYPGEGYCGLQTFHGEKADTYICEIPENEKNLLDDTGVPASVYKAMAMFFVGNAIRRSRGDTGVHAMLIHPSQKKYDHSIVEMKIRGILNLWKQMAKLVLAGHKDISYEPLRKQLCSAYNMFVDSGVRCVSFQELEVPTLNIIKECSPVLVCNSDKNSGDNATFYKTNIFVGGNLVERGLTIKGLAVTYITRRAKGKSNVDNTEQRARWFGYKAKYIDVCRVFTTKDIKDDFASILEHDEDMWSTIERAQKKGVAFKDIPRIFTLQRASFLALTRRNVARTKQYELSEWKPQQLYIKDEKIAQRNNQVISTYRSIHENQIEMKEYNPIQKHAFIRGIKYMELYSSLLAQLEYPTDEVMNLEFFSKFAEAIEKENINPDVDLVWIRDESHEERKVSEDGQIQQLFQGRNPNASSATYYDGDRSIVNDNPNHIQIQIHYVKPSKNSTCGCTHYSPALAMYVPEWCADRLSKNVERSNG